MPRGDRTGPDGMGPATGRGAGYCAGFNVPGFVNSVMGRGGFGIFGRGHGRGFRNMYWATGLPGWSRYNAGFPYPYQAYASGAMPVPQEVDVLKDQAKSMQDNLHTINIRIKELEKQEAQKARPK